MKSKSKIPLSRVVIFPLIALLVGIALAATEEKQEPIIQKPMSSKKPEKLETATLGAGCFWCVEAVFQRINGVYDVKPGYTGGKNPNPTYEQICTGQTGHAEVAQLEFDPEQISFSEILDIFFKSHDPTTLNRQGNDVGTQYRSAIFYHDDAQKAAAEASIAKWNEAKAYDDPIVTEVTPLDVFYEAENYHDDYYNNNPNAGYCAYVIRPKLKKLGLE
ncbi:peptide-methionine (S)-S-oxide reductase MsrA [Rubellicoccus peritrichatus]|uniref:Peptide methionine sulfoxide reductase MsrA n=1 Tax=Rubellicoccus peritrichatus TaxID=3080537 RepID=A0AAQ3QWJ1_9BACT|nr:peptide-methionine (S)-S-oxide reductase MsrA [Puniceicoccus sp. CR14]WOO41942.1 peptide-methionine (S)-S-oxide reductase MsrA [Puniceicoccus sp. CR14]